MCKNLKTFWTENDCKWMCACRKQCKITYQYWKNVISKFDGWANMSTTGGTERSGVGCDELSVLLGDGGALVSVCVCASVVMKLRFRCTASYSATRTALLALVQNTDKEHWKLKT